MSRLAILKNYIRAFSPLNIILVVLVVVGLAAVIRFGAHIQNLKSEVVTKKAQAIAVAALNDEILKTRNSIKPLQTQGEKIDQLIPTRKEVLNNIKSLEGISSQTGNQEVIRITELAPSAAKKQQALKSTYSVTLPPNFGSVDYTIELTGGFIDLMEYLELLESQPFLTIAKKITLEAGKSSNLVGFDNPNSGIVNTRVEATFFFTK
ncbi:MAG TPA: hypothetical protein VEA37_10685 [Flavobacterium sp.]|nr:hypothetical protein [Flavobacterium sp.]